MCNEYKFFIFSLSSRRNESKKADECIRHNQEQIMFILFLINRLRFLFARMSRQIFLIPYLIPKGVRIQLDMTIARLIVMNIGSSDTFLKKGP